jgi:hypothetical protein
MADIQALGTTFRSLRTSSDLLDNLRDAHYVDCRHLRIAEYRPGPRFQVSIRSIRIFPTLQCWRYYRGRSRPEAARYRNGVLRGRSFPRASSRTH